MDTNQAEEQSAGDDWSWWDQEWTHEEIEEQKTEDIDFINSKGKGKGKGNCYNCGKPGHRAFECTHPKRENGDGKGGSSSEGKGKGKPTMGYAMSEMWNAIRSMKGQKGGGKGKGSQGNCERCGKYGHKAKECRSSLPAREVEEEEKSEIDWVCMIDEEAQDLNAADEEKQSCAEFDARGLSEYAKNQAEERKKRWYSFVWCSLNNLYGETVMFRLI